MLRKTQLLRNSLTVYLAIMKLAKFTGILVVFDTRTRNFLLFMSYLTINMTILLNNILYHLTYLSQHNNGRDLYQLYEYLVTNSNTIFERARAFDECRSVLNDDLKAEGVDLSYRVCLGSVEKR